MALRQKHIEVYYLGALLITGGILGGGISKFLYTDFLLQIMTLPALVWALYRYKFDQSTKLVIVVLLILTCMLVPFVWTLARDFGHNIGTVELGRSLDSVAIVVTILAVFGFAISLGEVSRARVAQFFLVGVAINFAFSLAQFSAKSPEITIAGFPYVVRAGFFEIENHLSALFLVAIPFVILAFKNTTWSFLSIPLAGTIALYQFVIGSSAGVAIGFVCVLASIATVTETRTIRIASSLAALLGAAGLIYFIPALLSLPTNGDAAWSAVLQNTLTAMAYYLPFGSGFGTFALVYPGFGANTGTNLSFPEHANNDYLELIVEGGVFAGALLAGYLACLIALIFKRPLSDFQKAALLGVIILLVHSSFDFPLRAMGLAMTFAYLNAVVFGPIFTPNDAESLTSSTVPK